MQPFLALITPLSGGPYPDQGLPQPQPPFPTQPPYPPRPSHPIYYPDARPDQGLPGNQPYPDQGLPGNQPYPDQGLPGFQPYPDQGLPGPQPRPDHGLPPFPAHPIWLPIGEGPPIVEPPDLPDEWPDLGPIDWKVGWSAETGWVVVGVPNVPHPVPSGTSNPPPK